MPEPLLNLPDVGAVVQVRACEGLAEAMKFPLPAYRVVFAVLFLPLANVLAVTAVQLGAVSKIFQDTEEVPFHAALTVWEHILRVPVAGLILLEGRDQVIRQRNWAGFAVLRAGPLLGNEQNLLILEVNIAPH